MRLMIRSRPVVAAFTALFLAFPPGISAQMIGRAVRNAKSGATPVRVGSLTSLSASSLGGGSSVLGAAGMKSALPGVLAAPSVRSDIAAEAFTGTDLPGAPAPVVLTPSEISPRNITLPVLDHNGSPSSLQTIADALGQEKTAAARLPGLASLGADITPPSKNESLGAQREGIGRFFGRKIGLDSDPLKARGVTYAGPKDGSPKAGVSMPLRGGGGVGQYPSYPSRRIRFNGKSFPSVAFRPDRNIEPIIVDAIERTKKTLRISLYEFKNREILKALRGAKRRGVDIQIVLDYDHVYPHRRPDSKFWPHRSLEIQSLINEGFDIKVLRGLWKFGIQHNKFAVFDGKFASFGSYNWTYTSERNHYENVVFTSESKRVKGLEEFWNYLAAQSVSVEEAQTHEWPNKAPPPPVDADPDVHHNGVNFPAYVFAPGGDADEWAVRALQSAKHSIDLTMFTFSSPRVARALLEAKARKVKVRVLMDESQSKNDYMKVYAEWLAFHKIPVKTLAGPNPDGPEWAEKNHNKFVVIDGKLVGTGSMNWTTNGFHFNFEGMYFINNRGDAASYQAFFDDMFSSRMSSKIEAPEEEPKLPTDQELKDELMVPPAPHPPAPDWAEMPKARKISFNNETFPSSAVRPQHPIKAMIVKAIESSKKSIHLALYEFDLEVVLTALRRAKEKGVEISIILDYGNTFPKGLNSRGQERTRSSQMQALIDEGFDVTVLRGRRSPGIMHHKFAVFDGKMVQFGSYNYSEKSEDNHFESVKFDNGKRAAFYLKVWKWMREYSVSVKEAPDHKWAKNSPDNAPISEEAPIKFNGETFPQQVFSPQGMVEDTIVKAIRAATASIDIAMFTFYSARVAEELLRARERNPDIKIRIVLDRMQSKLMKLDDWFAYYDFDVRVLAGPNPDGNVFYEKNHNKFIMIDGKLLGMGSYNYTKNAEENNYENVNFFDDSVDLAFFRAYFDMLHETGWGPLKPKRPPANLPTPAEYFAQARLYSESADGDWFDEDLRLNDDDEPKGTGIRPEDDTFEDLHPGTYR